MTRRATLEHLYQAFNARDVDAVLPALHPDVAWPNGWEGGVVVGRDAVRDYWTRQWREIDSTVTPEGFTNDGDGRITAHVRQIIRDRSGVLLSDGPVDHTYVFDGDLVRAMHIRKPDAP